MKYSKKRQRYEASHVYCQVSPVSAYSYNWWQFAKVIDNKVVFNSYGYSPSTIGHQHKVRALLRELGIRIDVVVEVPQGLQQDDLAAKAVEYADDQLAQLNAAQAKGKKDSAAGRYRASKIHFFEAQKAFFSPKPVEKKPAPFDELGQIIAYEQGELDESATIELFQHLIDNGKAWVLQGHYGRTAIALIEAGHCTQKGA